MNYSDNFACGCSETSRNEAEEWLRTVWPGLSEDEASILTGEKKTMRYAEYKKDADGNNVQGEVEEHEYDEHRPMDWTEQMLIQLIDEGDKRHRAFKVSIAYDQWCGVSITGKPWECKGEEETSKYGCHDPAHVGREKTHYGSQYDFGLLPYALAKIIIDIQKAEPVEPDPDPEIVWPNTEVADGVSG